MNCRRDVAIDQTKPVMTVGGLRLVGESEAMQRAKKPVSRTVTGEDAARAVAAVSGRRQADDQKTCIQRPEAGDRPSPILPILESPDFLARHLFAVGGQPAAQPAIDDFTLRMAATGRQGLAES